MSADDDPNEDQPSLPQLIKSVLASFAGVQSDANLDRDDAYIEKAGFRPYIIIGIVLTAVFVGAVWLVVQLILRFATN